MVDCLDKSIYTLNVDGMGTTIIIGKGLDNFKGGHKVLLAHFIKVIKEALAMSVDTENPVSDVHIYLKGCSFKNFPATIVRKVVKGLQKTFQNTLNTCHIHNLSGMGRNLWNCFKFLADNDTRKKIFLVD